MAVKDLFILFVCLFVLPAHHIVHQSSLTFPNKQS